MKFFRNKEIKRTVFLLILMTAAVSAGAFIWNMPFGWYVSGVSVLFIVFYLVSTYIRYCKINDLSSDIDHILHGKDPEFSFSAYSEGELSVLKNEIQKMTARLKEQQQTLQEDKIYLADSIADISHQIRTPLTSINLLLQLLKEPDICEKRKSEIIRELQTMLSRIDWLITTLLKISRLDAGTVPFRKEILPLSALIHKAVYPLQVPIELRNQELITQAEGNFAGDMDWTAEAIGNIVKNCMEHTPEGGTIRVSSSENALYSQITIDDTGKGIDKEDLPHIFERFYKGKNSDSMSFGVGLALARMIICKQNGTVKAENKLRGGAIFTVRFYKGTV